MTVSPPPNFECISCGVPLRLADPERALTMICGSCGSVLDLTSPVPFVSDQVRPTHHRPEGLVELGRPGHLGRRRLQVVGRVRYGSLRGADFKTFDVWKLLTEDGVWLRMIEDQGSYTLMIPATDAVPPPLEEVERATNGAVFDLGKVQARAEGGRQVRALHVEGEHDEVVGPNHEVGVVEMSSPIGPMLLVYGADHGRAFVLEQLEDRAVWSIFEYRDILTAHDALDAARDRAAYVSRAVAGSGIALLGCAFLGVLLTAALYSTATPIGEGWARFDFRPRQGVVEQATGVVPLSAGPGFYRLEGECGLDRHSRALHLYAELAGGERRSLVRCEQRGQAPSARRFTVDFRAPTTETVKLVAEHEGAREQGGRAHASWRLSWHLGSLWRPLLGLSLLLVIGVGLLIAWPFARRGRIAALEEAFEDRRAELALALRRRVSGMPPPGDTPAFVESR
jgi:hypothetical protein